MDRMAQQPSAGEHFRQGRVSVNSLSNILENGPHLERQNEFAGEIRNMWPNRLHT